MVKRHIRVLVVNPDGRPCHEARADIELHQFMASGMLHAKTNREGIADFEIEMDGDADITVWVNGHVMVKRGAPKSMYKVFL